jgi:hypothetical protein
MSSGLAPGHDGGSLLTTPCDDRDAGQEPAELGSPQKILDCSIRFGSPYRRYQLQPAGVDQPRELAVRRLLEPLFEARDSRLRCTTASRELSLRDSRRRPSVAQETSG